MPFDPAGNASLPPSTWVTPGTTIRTEQHNPAMRDIEAMLSAVLKRDGRDGMIGDLNMGGFRIENVAIGSGQSDVALVSQLLPIGCMIDYGGSSAPAGWLLCGGQAVSRATYAQLFAVIGTTFGAGDGSTTFNVPDRRGRNGVGRDNMSGSAAGRVTTAGSGVNGQSVGASGGSQNHALIEAELAAHTHTASTSGDHGHPLRISPVSENEASSSVTGGVLLRNAGSATYPAHTGSASSTTGQQIGGAGDHTHDIASVGSGTPHNNMPPSLVVNVIIKATY